MLIMKFTAEQIATYLHGDIVGDAKTVVRTFAKIEEGQPEAISFLANPKYESYLYETQSSIVLVNRSFTPAKPVSATLIKVDDAYAAIASLMTLYERTVQKRTGISPLAYVDETASVGADCYVAPFVYIGKGVKVGNGTQLYAHVVLEDGVEVGADSVLYPNVSVYHGCRLGDRVILHSGCVVGADGFGFAPTAEGYEKIPQLGIVVVEDDVEIGANACVDRSTMGQTVVHRGVKLDNLVQIAHNCEVGEHTVMSAQVGVAGSTKIGRWCMFGGQVGIAGHAVIGDEVRSGAQAGIAGSLRKGHVTVQGSPAIEAHNFARSSVVYKKLPEMYAQLNQLQAELDALKKQLEK